MEICRDRIDVALIHVDGGSHDAVFQLVVFRLQTPQVGTNRPSRITALTGTSRTVDGPWNIRGYTYIKSDQTGRQQNKKLRKQNLYNTP